MQFTKQQQEIIKNPSSMIVQGPASSGKTSVMIEKVGHLIDGGVSPNDVVVAAFTYRSLLMTRLLLRKRLGDRARGISVVSLRDLAQECLERAEDKPLNVADGRVVRRLLRQAMKEDGFTGTVREAEHIIRNFKSRPRKPDEGEKFFSLLKAHKAIMEKRGWVDRHDILRQHLIQIRAEKAEPAIMPHVFIDNVQDATKIQLFWLSEHFKRGNTKIYAFGNPNMCLFSYDGALGREAFTYFSELKGVILCNLREIFGQDRRFLAASHGFVEQNLSYVPLDVKVVASGATVKIQTKAFEQHDQEVLWVSEQVKKCHQENPKLKIGVVTRTDKQALWVSQSLGKLSLDSANAGRSIWETPGAIAVLDLLCVLLNRAQDRHLRNVLMHFELNQSMIDLLFAHGMKARNWLPNGAMLPDGVDLPLVTCEMYGEVQRKLLSYYRLLVNRTTAPQDVFKAAAFDMINRMNHEDKQDALIGIDHLLSVKGNLVESLPEFRNMRLPELRKSIIVTPVRDVRNMQFDHVFMPFVAGDMYPFMGSKTIGIDSDHDRRLFYAALTRVVSALTVSYTGQPSMFIREFQDLYKQAK